MRLSLSIKPFSFHLLQPLKTSQGFIKKKEGWLLKLEDRFGNCGWGEVSPLNTSELTKCEESLYHMKSSLLREEIEEELVRDFGSLGFGLGAALGELDSIRGSKKKIGWLQAPMSAILLPNGNSLLPTLNNYLENNKSQKNSLTLKWKVGIEDPKDEKKLLEKILKILPMNSHLRIDPNGGWHQNEAKDWANQLAGDPRLDWLEQPLPSHDLEGLFELSQKVPIALDESLIYDPSLKQSWKSWQVRHPSVEGDPRELLRELDNGKSFINISTNFETGIGRRWVNHMASLQQTSSTPTAPGLAPGWCPEGPLFSNDPKIVWEAE